jgi:molecular chaperone DnaK
LQGERQFAKDNKSIGRFQLTDIPPAPRGTPQIEVTFDIDANGILNVSAKDLGTGKEQKITITASSGLSQDEVEKMKADAEAHADDDRKQREAVETRNKADNTVYQSEKFLKENGDKIPAGHKQELEDATKSVQEALKNNDNDAIKTTSEKLTEIWQKVSTELYQQAAAQGAGSQAEPGAGAPGGDAGQGESPKQGAGSKDEGPIIDAEVVDEKKD